MDSLLVAGDFLCRRSLATRDAPRGEWEVEAEIVANLAFVALSCGFQGLLAGS